MKEIDYPAYKKIIRKHLTGIERIEFSSATNTISVTTKNVFTTIKRLEPLRLDLSADDIEVGIVALTGCIAYTIYLKA